MVDAVPGAGAGGARKRMKVAKFCVTLVAPPIEELVSEVRDDPLAQLLKLQPVTMFRSVGKSSLVTPISTLYASPEKIRNQLYLRLPAESGDGSIIGIPILMTGDAHGAS